MKFSRPVCVVRVVSCLAVVLLVVNAGSTSRRPTVSQAETVRSAGLAGDSHRRQTSYHRTSALVPVRPPQHRLRAFLRRIRHLAFRRRSRQHAGRWTAATQPRSQQSITHRTAATQRGSKQPAIPRAAAPQPRSQQSVTRRTVATQPRPQQSIMYHRTAATQPRSQQSARHRTSTPQLSIKRPKTSYAQNRQRHRNNKFWRRQRPPTGWFLQYRSSDPEHNQRLSNDRPAPGGQGPSSSGPYQQQQTGQSQDNTTSSLATKVAGFLDKGGLRHVKLKSGSRGKNISSKAKTGANSDDAVKSKQVKTIFSSHDALESSRMKTKDISRDDIMGQARDTLKQLILDGFQSDSPQEELKPTHLAKPHTNTNRPTRPKSASERLQKENFQTSSTHSGENSTTRPGPISTPKTIVFKRRIRLNLRSHLRDPRILTLFRARGTNRVARKPPAHQRPAQTEARSPHGPRPAPNSPQPSTTSTTAPDIEVAAAARTAGPSREGKSSGDSADSNQETQNPVGTPCPPGHRPSSRTENASCRPVPVDVQEENTLPEHHPKVEPDTGKSDDGTETKEAESVESYPKEKAALPHVTNSNPDVMNDDSERSIAAIAVEDINKPKNDNVDFRFSKSKTPSRVGHRNTPALAVERSGESGGDRDVAEKGAPRPERGRTGKTFPSHLIIDLDVRYNKKPVRTTPPPGRFSPRTDRDLNARPWRSPEMDITEGLRSTPRPGGHDKRNSSHTTSPGRLNRVDIDVKTRVEEMTNPVETVPRAADAAKNLRQRIGPRHEPSDSSGRVSEKTDETGEDSGPFKFPATPGTGGPCRDDLCRSRSPEDRIVRVAEAEVWDGKTLHPIDVQCPPGHRRALRYQYIVCEPLRASFASMTQDQLCAPGQKLIPLSGGRAGCVDDVTDPLTCQNGYVMVTSADGTKHCQMSTATACPTGQVPVMTDSGYRCQYPTQPPHPHPLPPATTPASVSCPPGQKRLSTEEGPVCLPEFFAATRPPSPSSPSPSDDLCPSGMTAVETSVGVYCFYDGRAALSPTTSTTTTKTPDGSECPKNLTVVMTSNGAVCGFQAAQAMSGICPDRQVPVWRGERYRCRPEHSVTDADMLCPAGQRMVRTGSGSAVCRYRNPGIAVDVLGYYGCAGGRILTQTPTGFFCQDAAGEETSVPHKCPGDSQAVRLRSGQLRCLPKSQATLKCSKGMELRQTGRGYFCQRREAGAKKTCDKGEVLLVVEGRSLCRRLDSNGRLCAAGFEPGVTEEGGFACKQEVVPMSCPSGFRLSSRGRANVSCVPSDPSADICKDGSFISLYGKRVVCQEGDVSGLLVPCDDGYHVTHSDAGEPRCELEDYVTVVCRERGNETVPSCVVRPKSSCKRSCTGRKKNCREIKEDALQGCRPRCANGGRCLEGRCLCPAGVTGIACQEDIDECKKLPAYFCQHGCLNLFGSFRCRCPQHATLNADGRTCHFAHCLPRCMNEGRCEEGLCHCPPGYSGVSCEQDVDECAMGSHGCQHQCINSVGSFTCICPQGSVLATDRQTCTNITCSPKCTNGGRCKDQTCVCPRGFTGFICQLDVNECRGRHGCSHYCINSYGSYRCACPRGFTLMNNKKTCAKA